MNPVEQTHIDVRNKVNHRYFNNGPLMFYSAETGLGKTTGFRKAIKELLWDTHWSEMPVLIMVPTRQDADQMYREMEKLEPGCAGVWTQAHDPSSSETDKRFTPLVQFTKAQAAEKKCLILTHNAGKAAEKWVGERHIVFVDEYPDPIDTVTYQAKDLIGARDSEAKAGPLGEVFAEAAKWCESQDATGVHPTGIPAWVDRVLAVTPITADGQRIKALAQSIKEGTTFQSRHYATTVTSYKFDLPFQDKSIIFSATAAYEGWAFGQDDTIEKDGPKVDYSNVEFHWKPWPLGVEKLHNRIMDNYQQREDFFSYLKSWIGEPGADTFIVCPKPFSSDVVRLFPDAMATNYGRDVGSNDYRDCTTVYLVSEFHKPNESHRAHILGHSGVAAVTEDNLKPVGNQNSPKMRQAKNDNYATHMKQMIARGSCRNVAPDGKAAKMVAHCMIDRDRFTRLLPELFPGAKLVYPEGHEPKVAGEKRSVVSRTLELLARTDDTIEFVSAIDLQAEGIKIKGSAKKDSIAESEAAFAGLGWVFELGTQGRYSIPSGFRRF